MNGDRMYRIGIKPNSCLGTYHAIDVQRITARYPCQQQTSTRCFGTPNSCPGKGMARRCEQEGVIRLSSMITYLSYEQELDMFHHR